MGLDIYVGTLTRYHLGDWQTVVARMAREQGTPFAVIRTQPEPDDAVSDPAVVAEAVEGWRCALAAGLKEHLSSEFAWDERLDAPYYTDKPDWVGYSGLLLLAAHTALPQYPVPVQSVERFDEDAAYKQLASSGFRCDYQQLLGAELWLPVPFGFTFGAQDVAGNEIGMGSSVALLECLRLLNERTFDADEETLAQWPRDGASTDASFEQDARFGLDMFLRHAELSVERRLPMKLDY